MSARSGQVAAIVLAAGASRRMGRQKLALPVGDRPMLRRVLDALLASPVAETVLVLGWEAEALLPIALGLPVRTVRCAHWQEGQSASIRAGLGALGPGIAAALFCPSDQPWLTPDLIARLVARWRAGRGAIVAPAHQGRRGAPVLFARSLFPELLALHGDSGGRPVIDAHPGLVSLVPVDDSLLLEDIDTETDYLHAQSLLSEESTP